MRREEERIVGREEREGDEGGQGGEAEERRRGGIGRRRSQRRGQRKSRGAERSGAQFWDQVVLRGAGGGWLVSCWLLPPSEFEEALLFSIFKP
jgi:hypothetical protein